MSLMWMPPHTTRPARRERAQRQRHERADGGEDDRRVERLRRQLLGGARPLRAELPRERLRGLVAGAGEGEHLAPLPAGDLGEDVGGGAEAVQAQAGSVAAHAQRAVADQAGAQQRRSLGARVPLGIGKQ